MDNLKIISKLLNVSIDYLLDDGEEMNELIMHESYNLSEYGNDNKKRKKDRVVRAKFPDAKIYTLQGKMKLTKSEKVIDNALGILTDAPFGIPAIREKKCLLQMLAIASKREYYIKKEAILWQIHPLYMQE